MPGRPVPIDHRVCRQAIEPVKACPGVADTPRVGTRSELEALLDQSSGSVICVDPFGSQFVDLPSVLAPYEDRVLTVMANPVELFAKGSRVRAVVAFGQARARGRGSCVAVLGDGSEVAVEVFNLEDELGCYIGVFGAKPGQADEGGRWDQELRPRRATYRLTDSGIVLDVDPAFTGALDWSPEDVVGQSMLGFVHPDTHEQGIATWIEMLSGNSNQARVRHRFRTKGGELVWMEVTNTSHLDDPDTPHVAAEIVNISEEMAFQLKLQQREAMLKSLTDALPSGVLHVDDEGVSVFHNPRWIELTGCGEHVTINWLLDAVAQPDALGRALGANAEADIEIDFPRPLGPCRTGVLRLRPLGRSGDGDGLLLTLDDITEAQAYRNELKELARRDAMTGVLNRLGLEEELNVLLDGLGPVDEVDSPPPAVLYIDLDRFKAINDQFGHAVGDEVLRLVTEQISAELRPGDLMGRLGGDEFLVVLLSVSEQSNLDEVAARIEGQLPTLGQRFTQPVEIGATVGTAIARAGDDFDQLVSRADAEMYCRKSSSTRLPAAPDTANH